MKVFGKGGKLNAVDIVILLVLVAALVFVAVRVFSDDSALPAMEDTEYSPNLRYTVVCEDISVSLADNLIASLEGAPFMVEGMEVDVTQIFNANKLESANIVAWEKRATEDDRCDLYLTIEALAAYSGGIYSVGTQEIRVGKPYTAKTTAIEINTVTYEMEQLG